MTLDLSKLEALAKAATGGPWYANRSDECSVPLCPLCEYDSDNPDREHHQENRWSVSRVKDAPGWTTDCALPGYGICQHDAEYIAAADPTTVLALVARLRAAEELLADALSYVDVAPFEGSLDVAERVRAFLDGPR